MGSPSTSESNNIAQTLGTIKFPNVCQPSTTPLPCTIYAQKAFKSCPKKSISSRGNTRKSLSSIVIPLTSTVMKDGILAVHGILYYLILDTVISLLELSPLQLPFPRQDPFPSSLSSLLLWCLFFLPTFQYHCLIFIPLFLGSLFHGSLSLRFCVLPLLLFWFISFSFCSSFSFLSFLCNLLFIVFIYLFAFFVFGFSTLLYQSYLFFIYLLSSSLLSFQLLLSLVWLQNVFSFLCLLLILLVLCVVLYLIGLFSMFSLKSL